MFNEQYPVIEHSPTKLCRKIAISNRRCRSWTGANPIPLDPIGYAGLGGGDPHDTRLLPQLAKALFQIHGVRTRVGA